MSWVSTILDRLREMLIQSDFVHLRQSPANSIPELVELMDRFLFGPDMRYPLEWDDFISWENDNPNVERIRLEVREFERLLFSPRSDERRQYGLELLKIRNRIAAPLGIPAREDEVP